MLESSLHSSVGSPLSLTDDLNTPEERLAARLVRRLSLKPPIDVFKLASSLASVTEKAFPVEIDGLCLDLKVPGKQPKIWLARGMGRIRQRFTLAHEIGHIIIPWHTGTIVDDLEAPRTGARGMYRQMEAEANRFAAELLMPSVWVKGLSDRAEHIAGVMHTIVRHADVSFPAALFRSEKLGPPGYIGAKVEAGVVTWAGRTKGTWSRPPEVGASVDMLDMPAAFEPEVLSSDTSQYYWWKIRDQMEAPAEPVAQWREILERILNTIPVERRPKMRSRINAVIGLAIGRVPRGAPVEVIYQRGLEASQNRSDRDVWLASIIAHHEFKDYVLARAHERAKLR